MVIITNFTNACAGVMNYRSEIPELSNIHARNIILEFNNYLTQNIEAIKLKQSILNVYLNKTFYPSYNCIIDKNIYPSF